MAIHMLTAHRIRLSLSLQAPFPLLPSPSFCDLLLVVGGDYSGSGSRPAQGVVSLFAPTSVRLGADPHAALRQMGCASRDGWDGEKSDAVSAATG